jgi:hypothetical protein
LQGVAKFAHGGVESRLEINESIRRPQLSTYFFACHQFPGFSQQQFEYLKWLVLKFYSRALMRDLATGDRPGTLQIGAADLYRECGKFPQLALKVCFRAADR